MKQIHTNTPIEPIPVYREGRFDRKYWYTLQAKIKAKKLLATTIKRIDLFFVEYKFTY